MSLVVSSMIADGMVFQQGVPVPVWGRAVPGDRVSVEMLGEARQVTAGQDGKWRVLLDGRSAGGPHEMSITASDRKTVIRDICFGEVWICSGQSNMELAMQRLRDNFPEEWKSPCPMIRQFKVPQEWDFSGPREDLSGGSWTVASPETLHEFSGVAWFFANEVYQKLGVPIGLVNAAWGGTPVEAWMSADALAPFSGKIDLGKKYADLDAQKETARQTESAIKAWYNELNAGDRGCAERWESADFSQDASAWDAINLPCDFSDAGLDKFCGVIWLRKQIEVPAGLAGKEARLWLGTITDADTVYVNGTEIGSTSYRYPPLKYTVPSGLLREGENRIVIRVVCCNGDGGVTEGKDLRLFSGDENIELAGAWEYSVGIQAANPCPAEFFFQRLPAGLFNAMISPILDFPCRGVIWYQGESNEANPREYRDLFAAHIADWQAKWSRAGENLPFLFVQLPIWGKPQDNCEADSWAALREAQCSALSLPATGMAAALEFGEWNDLHPLNKKGVGCRLALAAEKLVYAASLPAAGLPAAKENTAPGPLFRCLKQDGSKLVLWFDNCGTGLTADSPPYVTVIAGEKAFRLPAEIEGPDCVSVDVSSVRNPQKILYAWARNPRDRQLYNSEGLPMIPFQAKIDF